MNLRVTTIRLLCLLCVGLIPSMSYAWNLVCGVSVGRAISGEMKDKWDSDSHALRGIAELYSGVAELQRVELNADHTIDDPMSLSDSAVSATAQAAKYFTSSAGELSQALDIATKMGLGDDTGLGLLKSLRDGVTTLGKTITQEKHLPTLKDVQGVVETASDYIAYGVKLSNQHTEVGILGHGTGGPEYKIP